MKKLITPNLFKNNNGISLIEVLASLVILSIILISFMNFFPQMGQKNVQNENKQEAINIAKKELFYWKSAIENSSDFNSFKNNPTSSSFSFIGSNDIVTFDSNTISIKTDQTKSTSSDFSVTTTIHRATDLPSKPKKAYQMDIQLFKKNDILVSETYGYIFYKDESNEE
ncbi:type IV pilus modification PilV family protein [Ureibacillus aquaedulcis]|uniref:Type II secretion system protein n=1 Tax=Ureibacillus aquaedulcis TaxID=3058421 RepID=A0ABT8GVR7_9BACL|nr:type II secretion system protein [Ureibacillus sp. BA0131]MDN4495510.1 type II secretion system protein [Ureibacillus sp. BA0131]